MSALIILIISFSFFTQAAFGFGGGLIAVSLLSLFLDAKDAIILVMVFQFLIGFLIIKLWKEIDRQMIVRLFPSLAVGVIAGFFLFSYVNEQVVEGLLALYIFVYLAQEWGGLKVPTSANKYIPASLVPYCTGFVGGFIQGITGAGGPSVIPYIKNNTASAVSFRATVVCLFFVLNGVRLVMVGVPHFSNPKLIYTLFSTIPFFALSVYLGYHIPKKVHPKAFDLAINLLLLISAFSLTLKSLAIV